MDLVTDEDIAEVVSNPKAYIEAFFRKSLSCYIGLSYDIALEKGWWGPDKDNPEECNIPEKLALIHSEISEALEEYRVHGMNPDKMIYVEEGKQKPEGFAVELADAMIRIFDLCGRYDIPIEQALRVKIGYNSTRPYRHGGKNC